MHIHRLFSRTMLAVLVGASLGLLQEAQAAKVTLTRLDCGNEPKPVSVASFSDTFAFPNLKLPLTYSCYLIRHGDSYMLWDTGNTLDDAPEAPRSSLVDLLGRIGVSRDDIDYVGISHHHLDHTGQAASFPKATLLIGKGDWEVISATQPPYGMDAKEFALRSARLAPWISGGSRVELLTRDRKDVFGDGTVVMIDLPGHTPGHSGLLVKLEKTGYVLLTGDVSHFRESYASDGIPTWNANRADSLASLDRFKKIADNLHALVIIQHDPRDIEKLPIYPKMAE